jgi:hypothetical protein
MKGKKMKLVSYYQAQARVFVRTPDRRADYARAFECVRDRVRDRVRVADYDHVEKFFSPL